MKKSSKSNLATKAGIVIYLSSALAFSTELFVEITGFRLFQISWFVHELIAIATLVGFLLGAFLIWHHNRALTKRNTQVELLLKGAQGEFFAMANIQFDQWGLSEAERDIALLTVKGLSVAEIAECRQTSLGTIKSQNNAIYRKAGVNSRTQLLGALIDELLVEHPVQNALVSNSEN